MKEKAKQEELGMLAYYNEISDPPPLFCSCWRRSRRPEGSNIVFFVCAKLASVRGNNPITRDKMPQDALEADHRVEDLSTSKTAEAARNNPMLNPGILSSNHEESCQPTGNQARGNRVDTDHDLAWS